MLKTGRFLRFSICQEIDNELVASDPVWQAAVA